MTSHDGRGRVHGNRVLRVSALIIEDDDGDLVPRPLIRRESRGPSVRCVPVVLPDAGQELINVSWMNFWPKDLAVAL